MIPQHAALRQAISANTEAVTQIQSEHKFRAFLNCLKPQNAEYNVIIMPLSDR